MGEANRADSSLECGTAVAALSDLAILSTDKMDGKQAVSAIKNLAMATSSLLPDAIIERTVFASLPIVYLILKYSSIIFSNGLHDSASLDGAHPCVSNVPV
jgi:hypothetical protein